MLFQLKLPPPPYVRLRRGGGADRTSRCNAGTNAVRMKRAGYDGRGITVRQRKMHGFGEEAPALRPGCLLVVGEEESAAISRRYRTSSAAVAAAAAQTFESCSRPKPWG